MVACKLFVISYEDENPDYRRVKNPFSEVLEHVKKGETVVISYGRKKEKVAALIPYRQLEPAKPGSLGVLKGRAQCNIEDGFSMSDEELLES